MRRIRSRQRRASVVVTAAVIALSTLVSISVAAPPVGAAAPSVALWAPASINVTAENGTQGQTPNHILAMAVVRHDPGTRVDTVRFDLVHATSSNGNCGSTATVTCSGGYKAAGGWSVSGSALAMTVRELPGQASTTTATDSNYSQVWVEITPPNFDSWQNDGGDSSVCGIESSTRACKNTASFSFHLTDGTTTSDQTMEYWYAAESDGNGEDFPVAYTSSGTTNQAVVTAGAQGAVTISYTCDDNDGGGGNSCDSGRIRYRRLGDNATVNPGPSSDTSGNLTCANAASGPGCETRTANSNYTVGNFNADDNTNRTYTFRAPRSRGLYVIEALWCNDDGFCPHGTTPSGFNETTTFYGNAGSTWQHLGSFYVNDAGPTVSLAATQGGSAVGTRADGSLHPNTGATVTFNATTSSDTQVVDWNLNQSNTDGIASSGYETRKYGTMSYSSSPGTPTLASDVTSQSLNLSGYGSGVSCAVGVRVYDTGGVNATDASAASTTASRTCTTNAVPAGTAQTGIKTGRGANQAINLVASDADKWTNGIFSGAGGDETPTISITQPSQGTVTCSTFAAATASTGTFPCTYAVPADAAPGSFSFSYTVTDSHGGTSSPMSVSGSIKPTITGSLSPAANTNGWNNSNVTVSWTCTSTILATCTSPSTVTTEGANQSVTGTATDTIGNSDTASVSVSLDKTQPTISATVTGTPNAAGWYTTDVPVSITCGDALSGIAPGACPTGPITGEGSAVSLTTSVSDRAGNSRSVTTSTVKIDRTKPATTISALPTWSQSNVTATLTPSDNLSGVASTSFRVDGGAIQTGTSVPVSGDGVHSVDFWSTDVAGNVEAPTTVSVQIDSTAPTVSADVSPAPNLAGWNNSGVTVHFTCSDGTSGVATCPGDQSFSAEGSAQVATGTAFDVAGNHAAASVTVNIDLTAPTVAPQLPPASADGWYRSDVDVSYDCQDALSGVASCSPGETVTGEGTHTVTGTAIDAAGNVGTGSASVDIDTTAPTITAEADSEANDHGYWIAPVTVTFTCTDALSGIAAGACPEPVEVTEAGEQEIPGLVQDRAGNSADTSITLKIAGARPTITATRSPLAGPAGWNNEPVTVTFTCSSDALETCTSPTSVNTDGADQSVTGTVTDAYGQSASTTVEGISIDRGAPMLAGVATTPPNGAGWYRTPVTMHWTCSDALSGIDPGACPDDSATGGEGTSVTTSGSVTDRAGNTASAVSEAVQVDLTAPSTTASSTPTWVNHAVTLTLNPVDGLSGVVATNYTVDGGAVQSGIHPVVSGQGSHVVSFWSTDRAGNVEAAQAVSVDIDTQAPTITATATPPPNAQGWNNEPVAVNFTCTDADSGVASCTADQTVTGEVDTTVSGEATDNAGNTSSTAVAVRIDLTAPTITAQVPTPNAAGWFNTAIQVSFSCSDTGGSGMGPNCPAPQVFAGEGAAQPIVASGSDVAGNHADATGPTVSIDLAAPEISGAAVEAPNESGGYLGAVTIHWTCADALSGVAPASCPADQVVDGEGVHVVSGSVTDVAGNTSSASVTIQIDHDPSTDPGIVRGTVTDFTSGEPLAGALVSLINPTTSSVFYRAYTGTDGTFLFPTVADGTYGVQYSKYGTHIPAFNHDATTVGASTKITVAHGSVFDLPQRLARGHVITGVVSGPGGPVSGATIRVRNATGTFTARSDATGTYRAEGMLSGAWTVSTIAYGFETGTANVTIPSAAYGVTHTLTSNAMLPAAAASYDFKGTVRSTAGTALAGSTVRIWPADGAAFGMTATTGSNGRWSLPSIPAGAYQVDVVRGDYKVRWYVDAATRTDAAVLNVAGACTPVGADPTWGDPCARTIDLKQSK